MSAMAQTFGEEITTPRTGGDSNGCRSSWQEGDSCGPTTSKELELIGFTFWLLAQAWPKAKGTMMVLGRLLRCFEFRRPLMSLLRKCWPKGCIMLPMAVSDLRCPVGGLVSASDASESGGGLCVSHQLTDEGRKKHVVLAKPVLCFLAAYAFQVCR